MNLNVLSCVALSALIAPAFAGEGWMSNVEEATKLAAKENKIVLVEFTGSDWCPPCMGLKKDVFNSPEFQKLADKEFVLVELDFPKNKKQSPETTKYNQEASAKFGVTGFPTIVLLNAEGQPFWSRVGGSRDKTEYLKSLEEGAASLASFKKALAEAQKSSGLEKAKLLDKALSIVPEEMRATFYAKELAEIASLDKDDSLGYKKKAEQKKALEADQKKMMELGPLVQPLMQKRDYKGTLEVAEKFLKDNPELQPASKQLTLISIIGGTYFEMKETDNLKKTLKEAIALDPSSEPGKQAAYLLKMLGDKTIEELMKAQQAPSANTPSPSGE